MIRPVLTAVLSGGDRTSIARSGSRTLTALAAVLCRILGLRVRFDGPPPPAGACVLCPNHVSALDILVLARAGPTLFVSRGDVAGWPGIGFAVRLGGTVFVDRARRRDAVRAAEAIGEALDRGFRVVVFLESTVSDGTNVLPFRPSLLAPAAARGTPCVAVRVEYSAVGDHGADARGEVAWGEDVSFGAHAMRVLRLRRIDARVRFHAPRTGGDRKALAAALERDVRETHDRPLSAGGAGRTPGP